MGIDLKVTAHRPITSVSWFMLHPSSKLLISDSSQVFAADVTVMTTLSCDMVYLGTCNIQLSQTRFRYGQLDWHII